jgi:putative ABC transport system permease protein
MEQVRLINSAIKSIMRNRMRSVLTALGIIIGVASVIDMVAVGNGAKVQIQQQIAALGTNVVMIMPGSAQSGGIRMGGSSRQSLTMDDVAVLVREPMLAGVSPVVRASGQIVGGSGNWMTSVSGVTDAYLTIRDWQLSSGDLFTERDQRSAAKKAVIGKTIANELFAGQDPIGMQLRIRNIPFTITGVLAAKGQDGMGHDQDDVVLVPATTVLNRLSGSRYVDQIITSVADAAQIDAASKQIEELIRRNHRIAPGADNDFQIRSQTEIMNRASAMTGVMTMLLGAIAAVSLIVGGIGIMNIMLVSVTERTREIGIRMAIGARGSDILLQFLVESVMLSVMGGIIGVVVALTLAWGAGQFFDLLSVIEPHIVLMAFGFSAIVGVFFGFYPARKASRLNPIDALRYE